MTEEGKVKKFFRSGIFKIVIYSIILALLLFLVNFIFGYSEIGQIPSYLQFMASIILLINPYLIWVRAVLILLFGYLIVSAIGKAVYQYTESHSGESTASSMRTIIRIVGFAILLGVVISIIGVDPTVAVTISSFLGIAIGFAGQNVLGNVLAGIVIVINRPFKPGDLVTVSGRTGTVKEISLTRTRIQLPDGKHEVLIPSMTILTSNIVRETRPTK